MNTKKGDTKATTETKKVTKPAQKPKELPTPPKAVEVSVSPKPKERVPPAKEQMPSKGVSKEKKVDTPVSPQAVSVIDIMIENIVTDRELLKEADEEVKAAQDIRREIRSRLDRLYVDIHTLGKYATEEQQARIDACDIDTGQTSLRKVNEIAAKAFELIVNAQDSQMTNGLWYEAYCKELPEGSDKPNYTQFNIKCRGLFNTQKLIRTKKEGVSSRNYVISLNGRIHTKTQVEPQKPLINETTES